MARQGTSNYNRYTDWEFPEYEFQEYPKLVYPGAENPAKPYDAKGKPLEGVLVNSEDEEATVMAGETLVHEDDVRAELIQEASSRGMQFDRRWGSAKLRAAIEAHDVAMAAAKKAASEHRAEA